MKVPAEDRPDYDVEVGKSKRKTKKVQPRVCFAVPAGALTDLNLDDEVVVMIKGKVAGLETRENKDAEPWRNKSELELEMFEFDVKASGNEFEELAEDDA